MRDLTRSARLPISTMLRLRGLHLDDDTESGGGQAAVADEERGTARDDDSDESTLFIDRMVKKYAKEDQADADAEDGIKDEDEDADDDAEEDQRGTGKPKPKAQGKEKGKAVATTDDDDDAEDPDSGTSDEDDEPSAESDADSAEDDDEEHPDDAEEDEATEDSADDDDAIDEDEDDEEEGTEVSGETKAALAARGADLELKDVPKEYRPIVDRKLKGIDAAFTKVQQEATAFRAERTKLLGEEKFRADNPEIVVIELLEKNPDLFDKVNAQLAKNEDQTVAEAFKIVVERKRNDAVKSIEDETQGAQRFEARVTEVEALTKKHAGQHGIPEWIADQAVGNAVSAALREKRDVTNAEIKAAVDVVAKQYKLEHRGEERKKSKEKIKARTEHRRTAPPATKKPAGTATAGASASKKAEKIDWNNQESRMGAILKTARRIAPGTR